ncbi:PREDICTED: phosphoglycolate phosphatase 1B, chloroplastic-like [Rhagoletis zephyria]|uniref:phosphoglycolate phosphatase 1B, chloroplastic-like n=1 Tax=Rhagoletis zephyria TaxID=28612 RepID=UPI000811652A|nr:PREDICTED: phosphoglycolate phosphatase 1B, chloroplastic-like [Rhagoletis zephyria]
MFKNNPKHLLELTKTDAEKWLNSFDTILTDCDGVLWHEGIAIDGVPEAIALLKARGKQIYFVTNNGIKTRRDIWQTATSIGYDIPETRIIAPIHAIVEYLQARNFRKKVYIIGAEAIRQELTEAGIESFGPGPDILQGKLSDYIAQQVAAQSTDEVGAVIVGFDEHITFPKMLKASNFLGSNAACLFMTTNTDAVHRYPEFRIPGTGALLSALETTVGRKALQFGKPNPGICEELIKSGRLVAERTLMIGDVCKVDILFGHNCGFQTLLVGTGHNSAYELDEVLQTPGENQHYYVPDFFIPSLGNLTELIS